MFFAELLAVNRADAGAAERLARRHWPTCCDGIGLGIESAGVVVHADIAAPTRHVRVFDHDGSLGSIVW